MVRGRSSVMKVGEVLTDRMTACHVYAAHVLVISGFLSLLITHRHAVRRLDVKHQILDESDFVQAKYYLKPWRKRRKQNHKSPEINHGSTD